MKLNLNRIKAGKCEYASIVIWDEKKRWVKVGIVLTCVLKQKQTLWTKSNKWVTNTEYMSTSTRKRNRKIEKNEKMKKKKLENKARS